MKISGYGLTGDLELKRILKSLDVRKKTRLYYDANDVEDAALVILSRVRQDGYLKPTLKVELTLKDGSRRTNTWTDLLEPPLPRPLQAREVKFHVKKGILYRYTSIHFEGLHELNDKQAQAFFIEKGALLPSGKNKVYTPQSFVRGVSSLLEVLERRGFAEAEVVRTNVVVDDRTGRAQASVNVKEGPKFIVRSVQVDTVAGTNKEPVQTITLQTNRVFSKLWVQDIAQSLKATNYHRGFPDTMVVVTPLHSNVTETTVLLDMRAEIITGEKITLRDIKFEGQKRTQLPLLKRRVRLRNHTLLDRAAVEDGRYRLSRLGIFDSVGVRYDRIDAHTRDATYLLKEDKWENLNLLFGYGSYERLRAGVEIEQFNAFGRAHRARLKLVQSFKSTSADFLYTMPEFVGEDVDFFIQATGLQRDEISFVRREYGGGAGAKTFFDKIQTELSARYNYEVLSAKDITVNVGPQDANVSAAIFTFKHDLRDNPLNPRKGYKMLGTMELASEYLGGDVNYARLQFDGSYHRPLGDGNWLHVNLSHGVIGTLHSPQEDLPFNKRFFPGGDTSVRGFDYGEAAPRNSIGQIVGAETYTTGNFEFEQQLARKISFVLFTDIIGFAESVKDYPANEVLMSVGGGFSWQTIIGPVRLEYGYNVIKRKADPVGTVQFSIGFPF